MVATESTPLLSSKPPPTQPSVPWISPFHRLLLTTLALSISFVLTATTLLYSFHIFACQEYYDKFPDVVLLGGDGRDRCDRKEIDSAAAAGEF